VHPHVIWRRPAIVMRPRTRNPDNRACMACATAKRKCGRQTPQCLRCRQRGLACKYPPAKLSSFVLCASDDEGSQSQGWQVHGVIPNDGAPNPMITTQASQASQARQAQQAQHAPQALQAQEVPLVWAAGSNQDLDGTAALLPPAWVEDQQQQQQDIVPYGPSCSMLAARLFEPMAAAVAEEMAGSLAAPGFGFEMGSLNDAAPAATPAATRHMQFPSMPSTTTTTTTKMTVPHPFPDMSFADIIPGFGTSAFTARASGMSSNNSSLVSKSWFTAPETWKVTHGPVPTWPIPPTMLQNMNQSILKAKRWLEQWVKEGHSPFIHRRLYQDRFPPCVEEAYLVLSAYVHRTPANEAMVLRLMGNRAAKLLAEYGYGCGGGEGEGSRGDAGARASRPRDALEHIARCHALLIYQTIGLYDGDIQLRLVCEGRIPILNRWLDEMTEYVRRGARLDDVLAPPSLERLGEMLGGGAPASSTTGATNLVWNSWILAESIRRLWVITSGVQGVYAQLQQGRIPSACKGNLMFTTNRMIWEASSASAWEQLCAQDKTKLWEVVDGRVFTDQRHADVDDFTNLVIEIICGPEALRQWSVSYSYERVGKSRLR
jgi:hypothetical protein